MKWTLKSKVTEKLIYFSLNLGWIERLLYLIPHVGFDQRASLFRSEWKVTKGLLYLGTWGDWGAFLSQPWIVKTKGLLYLDLNERSACRGWSRGFSFSIWMEGNQGASLSQFEWKVTNGLLYLGTWGNWGASPSQSWIVKTKGLLYLDLNEK